MTEMLRLSQDASIRCLQVGQESQELILVDDFLSAPYALKNLAIHYEDFSKADTFYPGLRMPAPQEYTLFLLKMFGLYIKDFFNLDVRAVKVAVSKFSIVTTLPQDLDWLQRIPHFDAPSRNSLAMVYYLKSMPGMGTSLYRHRMTGFEYVDTNRYDAYMGAIGEQFPSSECFPRGYICSSTEVFEEIAEMDAVFNRLVMYRGTSLHSGKICPHYSFDSNPSTGRLTVTSFFEF